MKNLVIFGLVIATVVSVYFAAKSNLRMSLDALEGKTETIIRGDLTLPINATGEVRPARRVQLKAEASGEVIEIAKKPGDRVRAGDLLIRMEKSDEQRNVDKAKLDVTSAEARLEEAKLRLRLAQGPDLDTAQASVGQAEDSLRLSEFRKKKVEALDPAQTNEEELLVRLVAYQRDLSTFHQRKAALEKAKLAVPLARQAEIQAQTNLERAQTILQDAEERVTETAVLAPIRGIVGDIKVEIGDVIQGGMTNFGGGTVLATVLDMDRLTVGAEVDESDIQAVRAIAPAWAIPGRVESEKMPEDFQAAATKLEHLPVITVESFREETFAGVIELINPEPRQVSNVVTYMVDVIITSANQHLLLPGMRADIRFTSEHVENVLLCPNEAIREGHNNELGVYVQRAGDEESEAEPQFVGCSFGISNGRYSQILCDDLKERDVVYTKLPAKRNKQ